MGLDFLKKMAYSTGLCKAYYSDSPDRRMEVNPVAHYVIVREDLPWGVRAAQIVHAAGESSPGYLHSGTYAFVLGVPDEKALYELSEKLIAENVPHMRVLEPDAPYDNQLMAIGVVPARKEVLRKYFSSLRLLR